MAALVAGACFGIDGAPFHATGAPFLSRPAELQKHISPGGLQNGYFHAEWLLSCRMATVMQNGHCHALNQLPTFFLSEGS